MSVFSNEQEVYDTIGAMFSDAVASDDVGTQLAESGVILLLELTEPEAVLTVDMPGRKVHCGATDVESTMRLRATSDVAHNFWMGNVNVGIAIARGQIRVRGPVPTLIKLATVAKPLFPLYRKRFEEFNRS